MDDQKNSGRAAWKGYYPLEECLRMYRPEEERAKAERRKRGGLPQQYTAHGVDLLNHEPGEGDGAKHRQEQHTRVERRRREFINASIAELARLLPPCHRGTNSRGLVLQQTIRYIHALQEEIARLKDLQPK